MKETTLDLKYKNSNTKQQMRNLNKINWCQKWEVRNQLNLYFTRPSCTGVPEMGIHYNVDTMHEHY